MNTDSKTTRQRVEDTGHTLHSGRNMWFWSVRNSDGDIVYQGTALDIRFWVESIESGADYAEARALADARGWP